MASSNTTLTAVPQLSVDGIEASRIESADGLDAKLGDDLFVKVTEGRARVDQRASFDGFGTALPLRVIASLSGFVYADFYFRSRAEMVQTSMRLAPVDGLSRALTVVVGHAHRIDRRASRAISRDALHQNGGVTERVTAISDRLAFGVVDANDVITVH